MHWRLTLSLLVLLTVRAGAQGTFSVRFDQSNYSIPAGGSVPVHVLIEPMPLGGLYSYGVSINFDPASALLALAGISVPPDLNFNGVFGPGAMKAVGDGMAAVKGTVSFSNLPILPYHGSLVATFLVTDRTQLLGTSTLLRLSVFRTLGPAESIFVDGSGQTLDDKITFGTATVTVVPEPAVLSLVLVCGGCFFGSGCLRWAKGGTFSLSIPSNLGSES